MHSVYPQVLLDACMISWYIYYNYVLQMLSEMGSLWAQYIIMSRYAVTNTIGVTWLVCSITTVVLLHGHVELHIHLQCLNMGVVGFIVSWYIARLQTPYTHHTTPHHTGIATEVMSASDLAVLHWLCEEEGNLNLLLSNESPEVIHSRLHGWLGSYEGMGCMVALWAASRSMVTTCT